MGTRHLVVVYDSQGTLRVAQYGQWDGYPDGQGVKVLAAAKDKTLEERARGATVISQEQLMEYWHKAGAPKDAEFVTMEVFGKFKEMFPGLHRDTGAEVLDLLPCEVQHDLEFGASGLFCEWAYVIDYARNVLEVYRGFHRLENGEPKGIFAHMTPKEEGYTPVTCVASWPLDDLPEENVFLNRFLEEDEEQEEAA
jgi:hypothetical protein